MKIPIKDIISATGVRISSKDAAAILGITPERLREWFVRGYVYAFQRPAGSGTRIAFSRGDLYFAAIFKELIDFGVNREDARKLTKGIGVMSDNPKPHIISFVVNEDRSKPVVIKNADLDIKEYLELRKDEYRQFHIINLWKIQKSVDKAIDELLK